MKETTNSIICSSTSGLSFSRLFSCGVIFTRASVSLALLSLRENEGQCTRSLLVRQTGTVVSHRRWEIWENCDFGVASERSYKR